MDPLVLFHAMYKLDT